jgi:predicted glutamine amidotransferase
MSIENIDKFAKAIKILKIGTEWTYVGADLSTEEHFNKVEWKTSEDEGGSMISTTTCPHSEITWTKVKEEMDKL